MYRIIFFFLSIAGYAHDYVDAIPRFSKQDIEELLPEGRRFSAPVRGESSFRKWIDSSLDPALKDRDCAELPVQFSSMSLEEKVGQLLMVHFNGEEINEDAAVLIEKVGVGGIIYYNWANGLTSPEQVASLSAGLQGLAKRPLLIAVDQEGGRVCRLKEGFTVFPSNQEVAVGGDPLVAKDNARITGNELKAVGINLNLAPVADVNNNPRNPVIGNRSFGDSVAVVTLFAKSALDGYHEAGVLTSLKHFPGHGDVEVDSHEDLPVIHKTKKQLGQVELKPFFQLTPFADTIMTAHILIPEIDPLHCATLSKDILDILRIEAGFQGVIIADSLVMEGVLKNCGSVEEAAILALNAGCDILLLGGRQLRDSSKLELTPSDVKRIHGALINAVKNGRISEKRVDEAVVRVLTLKRRI